MFKKIFALSAVTFLATAKFSIFRRAEPEPVEEVVGAWPEIVSYTTFKADFSAFTWDGSKLKAYKDLTGSAMVDSERNKVKVNAKVQVPLIGHTSAEILVDFENQHVLEYVPLLKICQKQAIPEKLNLKDLLQ